ncbi:MAG: hypothetical protein AAF495_03665 [Pseudomonadota bacterium]
MSLRALAEFLRRTKAAGDRFCTRVRRLSEHFIVALRRPPGTPLVYGSEDEPYVQELAKAQANLQLSAHRRLVNFAERQAARGCRVPWAAVVGDQSDYFNLVAARTGREDLKRAPYAEVHEMLGYGEKLEAWRHATDGSVAMAWVVQTCAATDNIVPDDRCRPRPGSPSDVLVGRTIIAPEVSLRRRLKLSQFDRRKDCPRRI